MCVCSVVSNSLLLHRLQLARFFSPWNFLGKNTEVGFHFLLKDIFLTQGSNPLLLCLLHWQVDSLPLSHFFCVSAASGLHTQKGTLTWSHRLASFHICISQILTINNKFSKLCVYIYKMIFLFKKHWKKSILLVFFFFFWIIPGMGEPGGLSSMGSHKVENDWSDLAAAAAALEQQVSANLFFFLSIFCLCYDYCCIWLQLNNYCNSCLLFHSVNITKLKCIFFYQNIWISPFIVLLL